MPFFLAYNLFIKYKLVFLPKIPILNAFKLFYYWRFSYVIKIKWIGATIKKKREKDYGVQLFCDKCARWATIALCNATKYLKRISNTVVKFDSGRLYSVCFSRGFRSCSGQRCRGRGLRSLAAGSLPPGHRLCARTPTGGCRPLPLWTCLPPRGSSAVGDTSVLINRLVAWQNPSPHQTLIF